MRRTASARLGVYAAFASAAFLLALVLGRPELAALAAPFAAFPVLALALARAPELTVAVTLAEVRVAARARRAGAVGAPAERAARQPFRN